MGAYKNYADHAAYMAYWYQKRKARAIALLGGICVACGSTEDLEFDHVDPPAKSFTITNNLARAWKLVLEELKKCQLLCSQCHDDKTHCRVE